ncbi:hypothetical protein DFH09DRAFT_1273000 [Mycena vulgaris]|nr:hypothetical protein DFH09DRAFT_1273000 [Mycena vulgaris]
MTRFCQSALVLTAHRWALIFPFHRRLFCISTDSDSEDLYSTKTSAHFLSNFVCLDREARKTLNRPGTKGHGHGHGGSGKPKKGMAEQGSTSTSESWIRERKNEDGKGPCPPSFGEVGYILDKIARVVGSSRLGQQDLKWDPRGSKKRTQSTSDCIEIRPTLRRPGENAGMGLTGKRNYTPDERCNWLDKGLLGSSRIPSTAWVVSYFEAKTGFSVDPVGGWMPSLGSMLDEGTAGADALNRIVPVANAGVGVSVSVVVPSPL